MKIRVIHIISMLLLAIGASADRFYFWVELSDKNESAYSLLHPEDFLSDRAIERRFAQNISMDSCDLPVSETYIDKIIGCGVNYVHQSKWLNGITISTDDSSKINLIRQLHFVRDIELTHDNQFGKSISRQQVITNRDYELLNKFGSVGDTLTVLNYTEKQNSLISVDRLMELGFRGKGKRIAVIDTGFPYIDSDSATQYNIVGTYNIAYPGTSIYDMTLHNHGSYCLSLMAGNMNTDYTYMGAASEAEYCLMVTEINESESLLEIDHWVRAIEIADSMGVDIVSSSLGYATMDDKSMSLTYDDMNGKVARCSRAANIASKKGMVVCISAGNEAIKPWHYITAPADADGILAVGAVNILGLHCPFSSFGPTSDGRVKPDICAMGSDVGLYNNGKVISGRGTSFAAPQISAGVAALWSAYPNLTSDEIRSMIIENANGFDNPNDSLGYGIANFFDAYTKGQSMKYELDKYIIYSSNWLTISCVDDTIFDVRLYDMTGRLMMMSHDMNNHVIDISHLPHGIYIVKIGKESLKIIR